MQLNRQKLPKDWTRRLQTIQAKSCEAIKDLPAGSGLGQQDASPLDYLRAVEIRDALSAKCERTMFGGLTGQAAVWDKIVKAYENGGETACMHSLGLCMALVPVLVHGKTAWWDWDCGIRSTLRASFAWCPEPFMVPSRYRAGGLCRPFGGSACRHLSLSPCLPTYVPCLLVSGVFLGEAAQTLVQNVDYEIPFLRKQGARFDQQVVRPHLGPHLGLQCMVSFRSPVFCSRTSSRTPTDPLPQVSDSEKKAAEYLRSAAQSATSFAQECRALGIDGVSLVCHQSRTDSGY